MQSRNDGLRTEAVSHHISNSSRWRKSNLFLNNSRPCFVPTIFSPKSRCGDDHSFNLSATRTSHPLPTRGCIDCNFRHLPDLGLDINHCAHHSSRSIALVPPSNPHLSHPPASISAMAFLSAGSTTAASNTTGDISKDVALVSPPDDSISDLAFSPTGAFLAVASWDKKMRIYQVTDQGTSEGKAQVDFDGPVLGCAWSSVCTFFHSSSS